MKIKRKRILCAITGRDCKWPSKAFITEQGGQFSVSYSTMRRWCKDMGLDHPIVWIYGDPLEEADSTCTVWRGRRYHGFVPVRFALDNFLRKA